MNETLSTSTTEVKSLCPYIAMPFRNCYIKEWGDQYTFSVIYYCINYFEECDIFKTNGKGN